VIAMIDEKWRPGRSESGARHLTRIDGLDHIDVAISVPTDET
jgi:hypothetical protein